MSGTLLHTPADIVSRVLIALSMGSDPEHAPGQPWPIWVGEEGPSPDDAVTVIDPPGTARRDNRLMIDGEVQEHHAIQLRIRGTDKRVSWVKARALAVAIDQGVYCNAVTIDSAQYTVYSVSRTGDVASLGKEAPDTYRWICTINALVALRKTN